jgi:hypothetical protein
MHERDRRQIAELSHKVQVCIGRIPGCALITFEAFFGAVEQGYSRLNPSMCFAAQPQGFLKASFNHDKEHKDCCQAAAA